MFTSSLQTLKKFIEVLEQIPQEAYTKPCIILSEASIGKHTRHCIEMYQCLFEGYIHGIVCYDKRQRNERIEIDKDYAISLLEEIQLFIEKPNIEIELLYELNGAEIKLNSNYSREVLYNLEHTIHHQALMKVAILQFTNVVLPESFGVAPSTIQFRISCAQ